MASAGAVVLRAMGEAAEPWRAKPASRWTKKDLWRIVEDSPWALRVSASRPGMPEFPSPGGPDATSRPGPRGQEGGLSMPPPPPVFTFLVRWESAAPVREALARLGDTKPAEGQDGRYVISVITVVPRREGGERMQPAGPALERILRLTSLRRSDHPDLHPVAAVTPTSGPGLLTYYFEAADAITSGEASVEFATEAAPARIRCKFRLKDMMFQGRLAL